MSNRRPMYAILDAEGSVLGHMSAAIEEGFQELVEATFPNRAKVVKVCWACLEPFEHEYFTCCEECRGVKGI